MFIHIINKLEPVIKIVPEDDDRTVLDFEECDIGETMPDRVSYSTYEGGMSVFADPKNAANKVIRFYHNPSSIGASRLYITPTGSHNPTALVFETDIYIESATETSTALQMRIAGYLFTMGFKNGNATLGDASSTDSKVSKYNGFGEVFKMGEWHNLRVEFYPNIGDGTCRAKLYVDDVLVGVSKNFEGAHNAGATPSTSFNYVSIYTLIASKESILLDNIHCFKDTLVYKEEEVGATRK